MRRWIALGLLLSLSSCAKQELPPALPEAPVLLEPFLSPAMTDDAVPMRDCPSAADVPYQRRRAGRREPVQVRLEPGLEVEQGMLIPPGAVAPSKGKPVPVEQLIAQANKAALVRPTEQGYFGGRAVYRYTYTPGKVYVIYTSPQQFTKLYFPPGEKAATLPTLNEEQWKTVTARIGPPGRTQEVLGVRPVDDTLTTNVAMEMDSGRRSLRRRSEPRLRAMHAPPVPVPSRACSCRWTWQHCIRGIGSRPKARPDLCPRKSLMMAVRP